MFLISGVLAPRILPPPAPGWDVGYGPDAGVVPPPVAGLLLRSRRALVRTAVEGRASFLVDREGRGFIVLRTHMGCLLAEGDPVFEGVGRSRLVQEFIALARSGGRVPVVRQVRPEHLPLYDLHGLVPREDDAEWVVDLRSTRPPRTEDRPAGDPVRGLEACGASVNVVPTQFVPSFLPDLESVDPDLDRPALLRAGVAVVRLQGTAVAFAPLWTGAEGGEVALDRYRQVPGAPAGLKELLLEKVVEWALLNGFTRILLGGFGPPVTPATARGPGARPQGGLSMVREPRYTLQPPGWRGAWAAVVTRFLTNDLAA